jgi:predicted  nucleic acid-binding Zn-ribbon protein
MTDSDIQKANDLLSAISRQRDEALNALAHAQADIAALRRQFAAAQQSVVEAKPQIPAPLANGHADQSQTSAQIE